jgi:hexosaminidase
VTPAKARGVYKTILCAGKEETYAFVEALLDEMIPLFDSKYFHIGGDEAPKDEWKECSHCNAKMKELGLTSYEDLQGYFTSCVCEVLKKYGKTPIVWNDALLASNLPEDVVVQYWTIDYAKEMSNFVDKKFRFFGYSSLKNYTNYGRL